MEQCRHERTAFGRVLFAGGGAHVMERCLECGANARGPGAWVSQTELGKKGLAPRDLSVFADRRSAEEKGEQRLLF